MSHAYMRVTGRGKDRTARATSVPRAEPRDAQLPEPAPRYEPCWCGQRYCRSGWPPDAPPPADVPDPTAWLRENGYQR